MNGAITRDLLTGGRGRGRKRSISERKAAKKDIRKLPAMIIAYSLKRRATSIKPPKQKKHVGGEN